jgi:dTDP-glucose pyrophosphorylase
MSTAVTKGVILVGGPSKGTRMRPLSLDCECTAALMVF